MAEPDTIVLRDGDIFIRRVRFADQVKRGVVGWRAFQEPASSPTLSFTLQAEELVGDDQIDSYREHFSAAIGGNLPALLVVLHEALTTIVRPPLPPRPDPDPEDARYGHLHCVTENPNREQKEILAKIVMDGQWGRVLRQFEKRPVRPVD